MLNIKVQDFFLQFMQRKNFHDVLVISCVFLCRDSSGIIMTFTSASVSTQELKTFVDNQLAANNVMVNTTGNNTGLITTTAFTRFGKHIFLLVRQ